MAKKGNEMRNAKVRAEIGGQWFDATYVAYRPELGGHVVLIGGEQWVATEIECP